MVAVHEQNMGNLLSRYGDYLDVNPSWVRAATALAALVAAVTLLAEPASAHNSFSSSNPKDKAVLDAAPATVSLKFLAKLSPTATKVSIVGPDGQAGSGTPQYDGSTVTIPLTPTLPGVYTVSYQVPSTDGHPITGKVTFTLTEKAVPNATPTAPDSTPTGAGATPVEPTASVGPPVAVPVPTSAEGAAVGDVPTSGTGDGGMPWWPWALLAGLVVAGAGGFVIARRRRTAA
jgi:LPXTG-motif cell wall-anchored protein